MGQEWRADCAVVWRLVLLRITQRVEPCTATLAGSCRLLGRGGTICVLTVGWPIWKRWGASVGGC
jgi:hypothetical protein